MTLSLLSFCLSVSLHFLTYLLENSHFLLFINEHGVLLKKLELHDRLQKKVKSLNFPVKTFYFIRKKKGKSVVNGGVPTP